MLDDEDRTDRITVEHLLGHTSGLPDFIEDYPARGLGDSADRRSLVGMRPFRPLPHVVGHTGSTGTWLFHAPEPDLYLAGAVSQMTAGAVPFSVVPKVVRAMVSSRGAKLAGRG